MSLPHAQLSQLGSVVEDTIAANDAQRFLLANRTAEIDCLLEDLIVTRNALTAIVGRERADQILAGPFTRVRQVIELNDAEWRGEHAVRGTLSELAQAAHRAARTADMQSALSIRGLRDALVPPLATLASPGATPAQRYQAHVSIDRTLTGVPTSRITHGSLRAQLGTGPHQLLLELLGHQPQNAPSPVTEA